jgi:hypothetical protein
MSTLAWCSEDVFWLWEMNVNKKVRPDPGDFILAFVPKLPGEWSAKMTVGLIVARHDHKCWIVWSGYPEGAPFYVVRPSVNPCPHP